MSKKPSQYDDLRMCFYIFFGLTSVVSLLSLLSKRAVKTHYELGGHAPQALSQCATVMDLYVTTIVDQHSTGSRISSDTIAVAPILCLKQIQSGVSSNSAANYRSAFMAQLSCNLLLSNAPCSMHCLLAE